MAVFNQQVPGGYPVSTDPLTGQQYGPSVYNPNTGSSSRDLRPMPMPVPPQQGIQGRPQRVPPGLSSPGGGQVNMPFMPGGGQVNMPLMPGGGVPPQLSLPGGGQVNMPPLAGGGVPPQLSLPGGGQVNMPFMPGGGSPMPLLPGTGGLGLGAGGPAPMLPPDMAGTLGGTGYGPFPLGTGGPYMGGFTNMPTPVNPGLGAGGPAPFTPGGGFTNMPALGGSGPYRPPQQTPARPGGQGIMSLGTQMGQQPIASANPQQSGQQRGVQGGSMGGGGVM